MRFLISAALALTAASSLNAQATAPVIADQSIATPVAGTWAYSDNGDGGEAVFTDANAQPQLSLRCVRSTRRVILSKPATTAATTLNLWSSTATKSFPASFDASTARLTTQIANWDPVLDAIAYSRGRFAVAAGSQQPLVVPSWSDITRIVEDCRV